MSIDKRRRNYKYYLRKSHRYLGVFIGMQFVFWTVGGLYFSWTDLKEIHGDHLRKELAPSIDVKQPLISPQSVLDNLRSAERSKLISTIRIVKIFDSLFYEIGYRGEDGKEEYLVADAVTGEIRLPISGPEAEQIAKHALVTPRNVKNITYLTKENVGAHHEYREKPLPAWAVTFEGPDHLTVYLSAKTGEIGAFRTGNWRIFDFLWMLHTMDYQARDNINNYVLRGFSLLGITTILSGFLLFFASSGFWRRLLRKRTTV